MGTVPPALTHPGPHAAFTPRDEAPAVPKGLHLHALTADTRVDAPAEVGLFMYRRAAYRAGLPRGISTQPDPVASGRTEQVGLRIPATTHHHLRKRGLHGIEQEVTVGSI